MLRLLYYTAKIHHKHPYMCYYNINQPDAQTSRIDELLHIIANCGCNCSVFIAEADAPMQKGNGYRLVKFVTRQRMIPSYIVHWFPLDANFVGACIYIYNAHRSAHPHIHMGILLFFFFPSSFSFPSSFFFSPFFCFRFFPFSFLFCFLHFFTIHNYRCFYLVFLKSHMYGVMWFSLVPCGNVRFVRIVHVYGKNFALSKNKLAM